MIGKLVLVISTLSFALVGATASAQVISDHSQTGWCSYYATNTCQKRTSPEVRELQERIQELEDHIKRIDPSI